LKMGSEKSKSLFLKKNLFDDKEALHLKQKSTVQIKYKVWY